MPKNCLDEMQVQKKNKIGHQSFFLLVYLLLIDIALYEFGFRWLKYPTNVFAIILICNGYYSIRLAWEGAYIGPGTGSRKRIIKSIIISVLAAFAVSISVMLSRGNLLGKNAVNNECHGTIVLLIISFAIAMIVLITSMLTNRQNRDDE